METHVKVLGALNIAFGTFGVLASLVLVLIHQRYRLARFVAADLAELTSKKKRTTRSGARTTQPELLRPDICRAATAEPAVRTAKARMTRSRAL